MEVFKIRVPANHVESALTCDNERLSSSLAHYDSGHGYYNLTERLTPDGDVFELEQRKYKGRDYLPYISEKQNVSLDGKCKTMEVEYVDSPKANREIYSSVHELKNDGTYSVVRKKGNEIIGGYEVKHVDRKFAQGFKGKLEKLALKMATDANGCERKGLRNIGELLFKIAGK